MGIWDVIKSKVQNTFGAPMDPRAEDAAQYHGIDQQNYQMPGFKGMQSDLGAFADSRGGGQFLQQQGDLASLLMRQAQGQDSFSAEQLRQGLGQLQAQQMSTMASARPSNAALASRTASQNMGNIGAQMAGQQALAGIAERNAAAQAAGNVIGQGRQQDIGSFLGAYGQMGSNAANQLQGSMGYEANRLGRQEQAMQTPTKLQGYMNMAASALPVLAGMPSDIRLKQDIRPLKPEMDAALIGDYPRGVAPLAMHQVEKFVSTPTGDEATRQAARDLVARVPSYEFEYKPGTGLPPGRRIGQMAQHIERVVPGAVINTPGGKMVDYGALTPFILAAVQNQQEQLDDLEAKKAKAQIAWWERHGMGR